MRWWRSRKGSKDFGSGFLFLKPDRIKLKTYGHLFQKCSRLFWLPSPEPSHPFRKTLASAIEGMFCSGKRLFRRWPPKTCPRPLVPLHRPRPIHSTRPAAWMHFALELVPIHLPRPLRDPLWVVGLGCLRTRAISMRRRSEGDRGGVRPWVRPQWDGSAILGMGNRPTIPGKWEGGKGTSVRREG